MNYIFPEKFWWGSATSGPQSEGTVEDDGKSKNIWDYWFEIAPERFFDGVGPKDTSTFYKNYKQDIFDIASELKKKNFELYNKYGTDANEMIQNMHFDVSVSVKIRTIGVVD